MTRRMKLAVASVLASLAILLSGLGLVADNAGGEARVGPVTLLPMALGYDRAADALLSAPWPSAAALKEAAQLSRASLRQYPYGQGAWLRLAYVDAAQHGALTQDGLNDLARSYDLMAIDPTYGVDRVRLALENCPQLSRPLLDAAEVEVKTLWTNGRRRGQLQELQPMIANPTGRLALTLWINQLSPRKLS